jgi:hypothetical protein
MTGRQLTHRSQQPGPSEANAATSWQEWARAHVEVYLSGSRLFPPSGPTSKERAEMLARDLGRVRTVHEPANKQCACGGCCATRNYRLAQVLAEGGYGEEAHWRQRLADSWFVGAVAARAERARQGAER